MAEDEEAEQRLLRDLEDEDHIPFSANHVDFQVVNRNKGKSTKKKSTPVKSSYGTRGKTGNLKPFKFRCFLIIPLTFYFT